MNLKLLTAPILAMGLMACGGGKYPTDGSSDLGSREPVTGGSSSTGKLAQCNALDFSADGETLSARLGVFYLNGTFRPDYVRLDITAAPEGIFKNDSQYLQFFKWSEDTPGQRQTDNRALPIYFVEKATGNVLNPNDPVSAISNNSVTRFIQGHATLRANNFFQNVSIILTELDLRWDAVLASVYDSSTDQSMGYGEALLPAFSADPNVYAKSHPATSLQSLHPNYSRRNSGESETAYFNYTQSLCPN